MMISCEICRGTKKIVALGNISKDCPSCRGIGFIELPNNELKVTLKDAMINSKIRKKKKIANETVLQC